MKDWPHDVHPTGWYQIGWSGALAPGEVKAARYFDTDLVVWRSESGALGINDAYCPHLGAHVGEGGEVKGECLQCPWHGWRWDTDGWNTDIPYWDRTNTRVRLTPWESREIDGLILVWYDVNGDSPAWEWPGVPEFRDTANFYPVYPHGAASYGPRKVKPQSVIENVADAHHFPYVHGAGESAEFTFWEQRGHYHHSNFRMHFGADRATTWMTPYGPTFGDIDQEFWGLGLGVARFSIEGRVTAQVVASTPVDHEYSELFSTIASFRMPGDDGDEPTGVSKKMIAAQHHQISMDFQIWEHQRYLARPAYAGAEERHFAAIRRHVEQFYPARREQVIDVESLSPSATDV